MSILNVNQIQPVGSGQTVTISAANITATGTFSELNTSGSITVGNSVINSTSIGIGTTTTAGRNAGVGTANGTMVFNADTGALEIYGDAGWETVKQTNAFTASGGTEDTSTRSGYKIHTFTTPGSFVASGAPKACEVLVIGGGGGGGTQHGGGGGAGGFRYSTSLTLSAGTYTIVRGSGGTGGPNAGGNQPAADPGTPSYIIAPGVVGFTSITATAGGGGGSYDAPTTPASGPAKVIGYPGGSGGGGAGWNPGTVAPAGTGNVGGADPRFSPTNEGFDGGDGSYVSANHVGGGGGGASEAGQPYQPNKAGDGGDGLPASISGSDTTYAGGGGGGCAGPFGTGGTGGTGGGGPGGTPAISPGAGTNGTDQLGGGGGAAGGATLLGGNGGSGIVIIAYPTT